MKKELIHSIESGDFKNKRVFLRLDLNCPLKDGKVTDDSRIRAALPSIQYLASQGAKVICASHLGRPKSKNDPALSMVSIADKLSEHLSQEIVFSHKVIGNAVRRQSLELKGGDQILLLENLRYHEGEESNSHEFTSKLAQLCDVYVNDAFGCSHRKHASVHALPEMVQEKYAGFLMTKEIQALDRVTKTLVRPLVAILGGAKVSDKVDIIESLCQKSSKILIGGAMAYTFLRAIHVEIGNSFVEVDKVNLAKRILKRAAEQKCEIVLPVDHVVGKSFNDDPLSSPTINAHIGKGLMGLDIGPKTKELFQRELLGAKTVFWNGPMGVFEKKGCAAGTFFVAEAVSKLKEAYKICGGGDSVAALNKSPYANSFDHISTGGGASMSYIEGNSLPGIEIMKRIPR